MSASDMKSIRPMHAGKQLLSPRRLAAGFPEGADTLARLNDT
jgi:hypothetical protein